MSLSGGGGSGEIKETPAERAQAQMAIQQWNRYQQTFAPLEDRLAGEVRVSPGERAQTMGNVNAASQQQFGEARQQLAPNLFSAGYNPASGGFAQRTGELAGNQALATGLNRARADQQMSKNQTYGLLGVTQLGRGDTATALGMAGNTAANAQSQAEQDARIALNKAVANNRLIGGILGAGTAAATGGLNTTSNTDYHGGMTGLQADQWRPDKYQLTSQDGGMYFDNY